MSTTVLIPEIDWPPGSCWFVATPIGNLGDLGLRALAALGTADIIYAEDTRQTRRLLQRYGLHTPLDSYHDHNQGRALPRILDRLRSGERVAVVTDAGMPCISDPGFTLTRALREADLPWSVVPGPSSTLAALVLSGFPSDRFLFVGYPPRRTGARRTFLAEALAERSTAIVLESCHRIRSTLEVVAQLEPARELAIAREITKVYEETLRGTAVELLAMLTGPRLKGELVLVMRGSASNPPCGADDDDDEEDSERS
jgi:16S rRNA (cytidine1402-2'-O)-methyltransferase